MVKTYNVFNFVQLIRQEFCNSPGETRIRTKGGTPTDCANLGDKNSHQNLTTAFGVNQLVSYHRRV